MARRFFRRRGRPAAKLKYSWVTAIFQGTGIDRTAATLTAQICLDSQHWEGDTTQLTKYVTVRRIIFNWTYTLAVDFSTATNQESALFHALIVEDDEELDSNLVDVTSAGLLQQNRILATGVQGFVTQPNTNEESMIWSPTHRIDWKGKLRLQSNERIVLAHQFASNVAATLTIAASRGISRVLIEQP